jgi:outer membrane protein OmpA-like peptidoglycan-associated protein
LNLIKHIFIGCSVFFLILFPAIGTSQIKIEFINVEEWIKNNFVGQGVVIDNINVKLAGKEAVGVFSNKGVLKIKEGLVISTGDIRTIAGVNNKYNQSTKFNNTGKPNYDNDLAKIVKRNLYDISYIEFDFVPFNNSIEFNYQFGSDEYPEYVGSAFNDIFAFFISDSLETKNIALVPNKNVPVSVNTINNLTDSTHYINNNVFEITSRYAYKPKNVYGGSSNFNEKTRIGKILLGIKNVFVRKKESNIIEPPLIKESEFLISLADKNLYQNLQFDGITKKLVAQTYVEPYKKYHLKIIIADVADNVYDSAVFLEKGSFFTKKDRQQPNFKDYLDLSDQLDTDKILNRDSKKPLNNSVKEVVGKSLINANTINLPIIYFDFDSYKIKESEMEKISEFVKAYQNMSKDYDFILEGHTDVKGNLDYNYELSEKRNLAVLKVIQSNFKETVNFSLKSNSYLVPKETNKTDLGRASNRRVELKIIKK